MSVDVEALPPPMSGAAEVHFRRFLWRCYRRIEDAKDENWKRDPVFHRYVEDLQDELAQLRNRTSLNIPSELVASYVVHVEHLSNALLTPDIPLYCKKLPKNIKPERSVQRIVSTSKGSTSEEKPDVYRNFGRMLHSSQLGEDAKNKVEMHAQIQESLTDDLVKLARDLKKRTVAMDTALQKRDATMDSANDALEFSAAAAKDARKRASKQYKTSKIGTCRMLLMLLLVGFIFTGMIFFIRVTSFVGYRAKSEL